MFAAIRRGTEREEWFVAMRSQFKEAFRVLNVRCKRLPTDSLFKWQVTQHRCTSDCLFYQMKDAIVCLTTGNCHYCTDEWCDRRIVTYEHQYCELTGRVYTLDLQFDVRGQAQGARNREEEEEEAAMEVEHEEQETSGMYMTELEEACDAAPHKKQKVDDVDASLLATEETTKPSPPPKPESTPSQPVKVVHEVSGLPEVRRIKFESIIKRAFDVPPPPQLKDTLLNNAERLWCVMHASRHFISSTHRYVEEYHLLVILDHMKTSYSPLCHAIIPLSQWVRAHLYPIQHVRNADDDTIIIRNKTFTTVKKMFTSTCIDMLNVEYKNNEEIKHKLTWCE